MRLYAIFTPTGKPWVHRCLWIESDKGEVVLFGRARDAWESLSDNGPGNTDADVCTVDEDIAAYKRDGWTVLRVRVFEESVVRELWRGE